MGTKWHKNFHDEPCKMMARYLLEKLQNKVSQGWFHCHTELCNCVIGYSCALQDVLQHRSPHTPAMLTP